MKTTDNTSKIGNTLKLLREKHYYQTSKIAALINLTVKEYTKLERGTRELSLMQLCLLADIYNIRKSLILDFGISKLAESKGELQVTLRKIEVSKDSLSQLREKISLFQREVIEQQSAQLFTLNEKCF